MTSHGRSRGGGRLGLAFLAQTIAGELDAMGIVDQAVEDGIGVGRIADEIVPFVDRQLAGDEDRAPAVSGFEDFEEIVAGARIQRSKPPIIEDEELNAAERAHETRIAAVAAGEREVGEELGNALIEHRSILAAGLMADRAREPTLADAGRASDILPKNIRSKLSFNIRIIHAPVSESLLSGESFMGVAFTS
jgi:hypothetical protein